MLLNTIIPQLVKSAWFSNHKRNGDSLTHGVEADPYRGSVFRCIPLDIHTTSPIEMFQKYRSLDKYLHSHMGWDDMGRFLKKITKLLKSEKQNF